MSSTLQFSTLAGSSDVNANARVASRPIVVVVVVVLMM
jgi:hypothetical protein